MDELAFPAPSAAPASWSGAPARAPEPPVTTGHPAVDAALRELSLVAHVAPSDQLPAYQAAHRTLRETLASIDEEG